MSAFYLWVPSLLASKPATCEVIITNGDGTEGIPNCKEFYDHLLELLNINQSIYQLQITPLRSSYHSEYLDSDCWNDQWPVVWKLSYKFSQDINYKWRGNEQFIGIDKIFACPIKLNRIKYLDCVLTVFYSKKPMFNRAVKKLNSLKERSQPLVVYEPFWFRKKKLYKMELILRRGHPNDPRLNTATWHNILLFLQETGGCYHFERHSILL